MSLDRLRHHPDRGRVLDELHARPFAPIATPARLLYFTFICSDEEAEADAERMQRLARGSGTQPAPGTRYLTLGNGRRWERHGEFVSHTFAIDDHADAAWPGPLPAPGALLTAVDLRLCLEQTPQTTLVATPIMNGQSSLGTSFAANDAGFVEIWLTNRSLSKQAMGATTQRVLELETYRSLALLGLPVAEAAATVLTSIELQLPGLLVQMDGATTLEDNQRLLDRLTTMSLKLEQTSSSALFRLAASEAYAEIVRLRIAPLGEDVAPDFSGISAVFGRRFDPAMRTCQATTRREANLSRKLTRAAQLLRTRIEIGLQRQNRDLLQVMGGRLHSQLRLQQAVEGLSVVAISYYVASLIHYIAAGLRSQYERLDPERLTAFAIPMIVAVIAWSVRSIRRSHAAVDQEADLPDARASADRSPPVS